MPTIPSSNQGAAGSSFKITVTALARHTAYLDRLCIDIRERHRQSVPRAWLVQGLVEFMMRSGIDFTQFPTSQLMTEYLVAYFKHPGPENDRPQTSVLP